MKPNYITFMKSKIHEYKENIFFHMSKRLFFLFLLISTASFSQEIALLKYSGGGDWYANPTSLPNLIRFCNSNINTRLKAKPSTVEPSNPDLLSYPFVHMTGHGNVVFSDADVKCFCHGLLVLRKERRNLRNLF